MLRRSLSILLTLACAVHGPSLAWAGPPEDVDARAEGLFNEGKYLEAAELQVAALNALPESLANRPQRNLWATGAVNAYLQVFTADPTQCDAVNAGLAVADEYLEDLLAVYGAPVTNADEYMGMLRLRNELDEARTQVRCPARLPVLATPPPSAIKPDPPGNIQPGVAPGKELRLAGSGMMGSGGALLVIGGILVGVFQAKGGRLSEDLNGLYAQQTAMECPASALQGEPSACETLRNDVNTTRADGLKSNKIVAASGGALGLGILLLIGGIVTYSIGKKRATSWQSKTTRMRVSPTFGGLMVQGYF